MEQLNMKDIAIIDSLPVHNWNQDILEVGCGDGKLDFHLWSCGYRVYATDLQKYDTWQDEKNLSFYIADIFDLSSFQIKSASVVIASEVLEHLSGWKTALVHLIALAGVRLIITVPHGRSFMHQTHVNFWDDESIKIFYDLCKPYSTSIQKIRTKPRDVEMGQSAFLIIIDLRQNLNE